MICVTFENETSSLTRTLNKISIQNDNKCFECATLLFHLDFMHIDITLQFSVPTYIVNGDTTCNFIDQVYTRHVHLFIFDEAARYIQPQYILFVHHYNSIVWSNQALKLQSLLLKKQFQTSYSRRRERVKIIIIIT